MPADTVFALILGPKEFGTSEANSVFDSLQIRSNTISAVKFMNNALGTRDSSPLMGEDGRGF
jgi:hypothetical protein